MGRYCVGVLWPTGVSSKHDQSRRGSRRDFDSALNGRIRVDAAVGGGRLDGFRQLELSNQGTSGAPLSQ